MPVSLFTFVDLFSRACGNAAHLLTKGAEHAATLGVSPDEMLQWRLIDDMATLRFQASVVCNFARRWPARVAGVAVPDDLDEALDFNGLVVALHSAQAYLATFTAEQFAGRDEVPITFNVGGVMEPTLPAGQWMSVFATTNLYFHLSTAYGILRSKGVPLGKADLFATGL